MCPGRVCGLLFEVVLVCLLLNKYWRKLAKTSDGKIKGGFGGDRIVLSYLGVSGGLSGSGGS